MLEADSLPEFEQQLRDLAPDMLAANLDLRGVLPPVTFIVEEHRRLNLAVA